MAESAVGASKSAVTVRARGREVVTRDVTVPVVVVKESSVHGVHAEAPALE